MSTVPAQQMGATDVLTNRRVLLRNNLSSKYIHLTTGKKDILVSDTCSRLETEEGQERTLPTLEAVED